MGDDIREKPDWVKEIVDKIPVSIPVRTAITEWVEGIGGTGGIEGTESLRGQVDELTLRVRTLEIDVEYLRSREWGG